jgi:hypothetical protein
MIESSTAVTLFFSGCGDEHCSSRPAEAAVPQDQDRRHLHPVGRGHSQDPQQGVHVAPLQKCHPRRLNKFEQV